jgi:hypothetical protein
MDNSLKELLPMELSDYEYAVAQKSEGKWRLFKWLMIFGYIVFAAAYFVIIYVTRFFPLGALIPLFLWMLIYFTYKYVKPEYKYKISEGYLTFYKIFGKKEKEVIKVRICDAKHIMPLESSIEIVKDFAVEKTYSALPATVTADPYLILFVDNDGKRCSFMFKATRDALKNLRFYNKNTVMSETEV